jgi:GT2 family glycosyltransferase
MPIAMSPSPTTHTDSTDLGIVVIGRNEGERLIRCLRSVAGGSELIVYVDSHSHDDSVSHARAAGAEVVELDPGVPITAARARNAGFHRLLELHPDLVYIQFLDGDCEVQPTWLQVARRYLQANADVGVVCGRRRERFRTASCYNRLVDMEWDTPVGETLACGGDAMMRTEALQRVGGFDARLIAGEDPELCLRIRRSGFRIVRLDEEMTLHDAAMTRLSQWWRRAKRAGHAFAESAYLHGHTQERYCLRQTLSILAWAGLLPLVSLTLAWPTRAASLLLLGAYGVLWWRIRSSRRRRGDPPEDAQLYATGCVVGKFAELFGIGSFVWSRLIRRQRTRLIEYKEP